VLWGWAGAPLTDEEVAVVDTVREAVRGPLGDRLEQHLTELELAALERRCERLLAVGVLPLPGRGWPSIPWPPF
jgi:hypothetical protein